MAGVHQASQALEHQKQRRAGRWTAVGREPGQPRGQHRSLVSPRPSFNGDQRPRGLGRARGGWLVVLVVVLLLLLLLRLRWREHVPLLLLLLLVLVVLVLQLRWRWRQEHVLRGTSCASALACPFRRRQW